MDNKKKITLTFSLEQVCNDILAKCNLISKGIHDDALADIKADIASPDSDETRSIICRAVTEAFGNVKVACQRWLTTGRTTDNNNLERLVKKVTFNYTYTPSGGSETTIEIYKDGSTWKKATDDSAFNETVDETALVEKSIEYESIVLALAIPNFNTAVTDGLKSHCHKYVVDYTMARFLQDQLADKSAEYNKVAEEDDMPRITEDLNAREEFGKRKPTFY